MKEARQIIFHGTHFQNFYIEQNDKVREKIAYVFHVIKSVEKVPEKFLKHMEGSDGLFEVRIEVGSNIFRIFCCFDKGNIIVLFNSFQKKTQKTPKQEIEKALKIMEEYYNEKSSK